MDSWYEERGAWRAQHLLWVLPYVIRHIGGGTFLGFPWDVFSPKINKYLVTWTRGERALCDCIPSTSSILGHLVFHSALIVSPTTVNFTQNPTGLLWVHADVHTDPNLRGCLSARFLLTGVLLQTGSSCSALCSCTALVWSGPLVRSKFGEQALRLVAPSVWSKLRCEVKLWINPTIGATCPPLEDKLCKTVGQWLCLKS